MSRPVGAAARRCPLGAGAISYRPPHQEATPVPVVRRRPLTLTWTPVVLAFSTSDTQGHGYALSRVHSLRSPQSASRSLSATSCPSTLPTPPGALAEVGGRRWEPEGTGGGGASAAAPTHPDARRRTSAGRPPRQTDWPGGRPQGTRSPGGLESEPACPHPGRGGPRSHLVGQNAPVALPLHAGATGPGPSHPRPVPTELGVLWTKARRQKGRQLQL